MINMRGDRVLVRADLGKPLERIVVGDGRRVIYLSRPDLCDQVIAEGSGVGFPREDVFYFDASLFNDLLNEWKTSGRTQPETWDQAIPLSN